MSKAEGETLEDLFAMLSASDDKREEDSKEHFENMSKRLQGQMIIFSRCWSYIHCILD